jgi:hypothetical protein
MTLTTYLVLLATIGGISHVITIAEKTHKYAPILLRKAAPIYPLFPFIIRRTLNPYTIGISIMFGLPLLLSELVGPPEAVGIDLVGGFPFGILPF